VVNELIYDRACGLHLRRSIASWLNAHVQSSLGLHVMLMVTVISSNSIVSVCFPFVWTTCSYTALCNSWQNFDWHIASRGPSAIAELLKSARVRKLSVTGWRDCKRQKCLNLVSVFDHCASSKLDNISRRVKSDCSFSRNLIELLSQQTLSSCYQCSSSLPAFSVAAWWIVSTL